MDMQGALQALKPVLAQVRALQKLQEILEQAVLAEQLKGETDRGIEELSKNKEILEASVAGLQGRLEDLNRSQQEDLAAAEKKGRETREAEVSFHKENLAALQSQIAKAKRDYQATAESHRKRLEDLAAEIQEAEGKLAEAKADYEEISDRFKARVN